MCTAWKSACTHGRGKGRHGASAPCIHFPLNNATNGPPDLPVCLSFPLAEQWHLYLETVPSFTNTCCLFQKAVCAFTVSFRNTCCLSRAICQSDPTTLIGSDSDRIGL
eukprot:scaffold210831_cov24-Tisochrysis_lutea.AAC.1